MYSCLNNFVCYPTPPPPKKKTYLDPKSINNPKIRSKLSVKIIGNIEDKSTSAL